MSTLDSLLSSWSFGTVVAVAMGVSAVAKALLARYAITHRVDPRVKLGLVFLPLAVAVVAVESIWGSLGGFAGLGGVTDVAVGQRVALIGVAWATSVLCYDGGKRFLALPGIPAPVRGLLTILLQPTVPSTPPVTPSATPTIPRPSGDKP